MSEQYEVLLQATVEHLESLKAEGSRYVIVTPETLQGLSRTGQQGIFAKAVRAVPSPAVLTPKVAMLAHKPQLETQVATAPIMPLTANGPSDKTEDFQALRGRVLACVKCPHLVKARKNVVVGVGDIHSPLMFVGEAPGADEDLKGEPFVGAAGQLLTKIIVAMGYSRETVYIANILKCRPDTPGQTSGNRKPTSDEMKTCLPYLTAQIELIKPKVLVALGATAVEGLLGKTEGITKLRGKFQTYQGIPLMPTYHPAYLLRNQSITEKRKVWEDMLQVLEKLGAPISEKQRGYFLKP